MASRYDPHAKLIEDLYAQGESFTGIARKLEAEFGIPLDASGLRRWLLRRLEKRDRRKAILAPSAPTSAPAQKQQETAVQKALDAKGAKGEEPAMEKTPAPKPKSMDELIKESQSVSRQSLLRK